MPSLDTYIPLDITIHQHNGDPAEDAEISVGDGPIVTVNPKAVGGRIRQLVNDRIRDLELPDA